MRRETEDSAAAEGSGGRSGGGAHDERLRRGGATPVTVKLRSLYGAPPPLMNEVKKLNLGVLPVQCPPLCYKRAVNSDHAQLSHAAVLRHQCHDGIAQRSAKRRKRDSEQTEDDKEEKEEEEREEVSTADDNDRDGEVVGALLAEHDLIHRVVHIQTLAVDARHRRLGVGRQLVERVLDRAASLDRVTCVQLHVHIANDDALAFYQRLGFEEHQRIENYYRHLTPRTCLVLRCAVQET